MLLSNNMTNAGSTLLSLLSSGWLCVVLLALTGCNTPQQKAQNSPPPLTPPPQQTSQSDTSSDTSGAQQQTQAGTQPENTQSEARATAEQSESSQLSQQSKPTTGCEPAKQARSPDVEIIDVPLDEHGKPIEPTNNTITAKTPTEDECQTAKNSQEEQQKKQAQASAQQKQQSGQQAPGGFNAGSAQTTEEKLAAANATMDSKLAAFDELMRRAREAAEKQRAAASADSGGQYGGGYGGEYDGQGANQRMPDARGAGGQADTSSGLGQTPDRSGETRPGDYKQVATGPVPANMPDGRDDDIVARQLREAASKETDPVLRDKLWQEYKKYKTGVVGR